MAFALRRRTRSQRPFRCHRTFLQKGSGKDLWESVYIRLVYMILYDYIYLYIIGISLIILYNIYIYICAIMCVYNDVI